MFTLRNSVAALSAAVVMTGAVATVVTASEASHADTASNSHARPDYDPTRKPCRYEDGPNWPCYWDAAKRGNHRGASYWIGAQGVVHYVDGVRFRLER